MAVHQHWEANDSRQRVPAWVMSAAVHVAAVLLLAWLWQPAPARGLGEPSRTAGIVVAVQADGETEYFEAPADSGQQSLAATDSGAAPAEPADVLPSLDASVELPDIALPGAVQGEVSGNLLQGVDLGAQGAGSPTAGDTNQLLAEIMAQEAAQRPPAPVGTQAPLTLFGAPSQGRSFAFVIDRSKSMGASGLGALSAARAELKRALSELTPSQRFEIIAYHQSPVTLGEKYHGRPQLSPVTEQNLTRVSEFFGGLAAFGATQHVYALHAAMDLRPEVIFLLTDGGDPFPSPAQLRDLSQRAKRQGISIHCVQFGFGPLQEDENFMMRLARDNRGEYRYVRMDGRR